MDALWIAIILYSVGLGLVLHFRPALMFNENGTWKEFGYQRSSPDQSRHTLLPFWLFAIAWAFASYVLATAALWVYSGGSASAIAVGTGVAGASSFLSRASSEEDESSSNEGEGEGETNETNEIEYEAPTEETEGPRRPRGRPRGSGNKKPRPGYYVIDPDSLKSGLHKYVYYGDQPPA
jgi:hypothetical protein